MAHLVCRRGKYWSLEISVRVGKKVRKQRLAYYGTRKPSDPEARMAQMLDTAERKAEEWDDYQRKEFGETASERRTREDEEATFSQQEFLGETSAPVDTDDAPVSQSHPDQGDEQNTGIEPSPVDTSFSAQPSTEPSEQSPSEPDAEPSES